MSSIFESGRIRFTTYTDDDLQQLATWISDFGLQRLVNTGVSMPSTVEDFLDPEGWFQQDFKNAHSRSFAVRTVEDNVFIGSCALINVDMVAHHAEIGINIANPDYRSKGYGYEIMHLLMRYGFEQFHLNRIYLTVIGFNERAIRLYEKLGFRHEVREREVTFFDGQYIDELYMGILRSEWEAQHEN